MKQRGFTILELLFVIALLGAGLLIYYNNQTKTTDLKRARVLADQASIHAKYFINYLLSNESSITTSISTTNPLIISIDQLIASGLAPTITGTNILRQKPCLSVIRNAATNKPEAIMYYVSNQVNNKLSPAYLQKAAMILAEAGGVYNGVKVQSSSWQINSSSVYFHNNSQCVAGYTLMSNSLVVNFSMLPEFDHTIQPDIGLHRKLDPNAKNVPLGQLGNKNTSLSNIITSGNAIQLNNSGLKLINSTQNEVTLQSNGLMANTLQATTAIASGTACQPSEVNKTAVQGDPNIGSTLSNVICSYSPLICSGSGYCYIPILNNTVIYKDISNSGWMGSQFICPSNVPYLQSATAYQAGNPSAYVTYITSTFNNYTLSRGAIAHGSTITGCLTWQYTIGYGDNRWGRSSCQAGTTYNYPGNCGLTGGNAACDGVTKNGRHGWYGKCKGTVQVGSYNCANAGCAGKDWVCSQQSPQTPVMISSATCTSKLIIKAN